MQVKIDTKERFHVITPQLAVLSATMTDGMELELLPFLKADVKNVVLNLENVQTIDTPVAEKLISIQQQYYENDASFVSCNISKEVENFLEEKELLEILNVTPTESEAWDIVQMEEVERELFGGEEAI